MRAQWRWRSRHASVQAMGHGLWEVRSHLESDRIARVLFCVRDGEMVALHGFIKKTQKTSPDDLALALNRTKEGDHHIVSKKKNPHIGSTLDEFLKDEDVLEELQTQAINEVVAWQLAETMKARGVSKAGMAKLLHTSRCRVLRGASRE